MGFVSRLSVALSLLVSLSATATYSIVATDARTAQVGGAGVSCVGGLPVTVIFGSAPGKGVVAAQAEVAFGSRNKAVAMLNEGSSPEEIIAFITSPSFDSKFANRQFGIVDLQGRSAGYTGTGNDAVALHRQGSAGSYVYSVQGNTLTSALVVDQAEDAFLEGGCDLADKLMRAIEAGGLNSQGDSRCSASGIAADSGFIRVDAADGTNLIDISLTNSKPADVRVKLREQFDAWRASHQCPVEIVDAGTPDAGAPVAVKEDEVRKPGCASTGNAQLIWPLLVLSGWLSGLRRRRA